MDAQAMIDLNTATLQDLLKTPGISHSQAQALCARRPFFTWQEVAQTPGVNEDVVKWLQAVGLRLGVPALPDGAVRAASGVSRPEEPTES